MTKTEEHRLYAALRSLKTDEEAAAFLGVSPLRRPHVRTRLFSPIYLRVFRLRYVCATRSCQGHYDFGNRAPPGGAGRKLSWTTSATHGTGERRPDVRP